MQHEVARYVVARGTMPPGVPLVERVLTGGVSGVVVLVRSPTAGVVVKRALSRLLVAGDWTAKPERALTEAAALRVLQPLTPDSSPRVLDVDVDRLTFTMTAAPARWQSWREVLLHDVMDVDALQRTASRLGTVLATWHRATWGDADLARRFDDHEAFEQLRLAPFHAEVAARHPALAATVLGCADELRRRRDCLVHGDFSPKNVLAGDGLWVLDMEVAHVGAAVFDLAFMQSHLMLKALHLPSRAAVLHEAATALLQAYRRHQKDPAATARLSAHTACLLLARVDGLSPATYLSPRTADRVRSLAVGVLTDSGDPAGHDLTPDELWQRVRAAAVDR